MAEEFDLTNKAVILEILTEVTKSEDKDRRKASFDAYQIYSGNQKPYVLNELIRTRPKSYNSYTISDISLSKMVTDKRAQAYNEDPIRSVDGDQKKTEALSQIYEEADSLRELQHHDVVFNLNRYDLIWVNYLSDKKKYQMMTLQPYEFILVFDKDTGELLIVGLSYPNIEITQGARSGDGISDLIAESQADSAASGETWVFWSANQHVKVKTKQVQEMVGGEEKMKKDIDFIPIPGNSSNVNPLGVLPFVYTSSDTAIDYPTRNPLSNQSVIYNAQQSETLTAKNIHGSGIMIFKYPESMHGKFESRTHGQTEAVNLPQSEKDGAPPTDFEYETSGAQLGPMMEADQSYLKQILKEHGIDNVDMDLTGSSPESGIAKAIGSAGIMKVIERNQQYYSSTEKKIFSIIKAWDRLLGNRNFDESDELQIVFPKPKVAVSDKETLDNIKLMLDLGLIEPWEKFIKMDPNLSEQEAREKLERIEQSKEQRAMSVLGGINANKQISIDEEGEAESEGLEL